MPLSPDHVGRRYQAPEPYRVSRAKITEFARAIGDHSPAYRDDPAIAPPTFAMVIAAQAWEPFFADPELEVALQRMVHTDQRLAFERPLAEGDEVVTQVEIEKVRQRAQVDMITLRAELRVDGELVCTATSSLMHTRSSDAEPAAGGHQS